MSSKALFLIFLIMPAIVFSQNKADKEILESLQENTAKINLLSNNDRSSPEGQKFVASKFQEAGLQPVINAQSYLQDVVHDAGRQFNPGTALSINDKALTPGADFIPLPYSAQGAISGDPLIAVQEANLPWIIDINNYSGTQLTGADTDENETMYKLAAQAVHDKATAVLFYSSNNAAKDVSFQAAGNKASLTIPVIYINKAAATSCFKDQTADARIKLQVAFHDKKDTAYNVIGRINNAAASTIIITAYQPGDKAALIGLSRLLKNNKRYGKENYLFVAYGGKKGTDYFMEHPVINMDQTDCIINLNGTSKLNPSSYDLTISGLHSSPAWESILRKVKDREITLQNKAPDDSSAINIPFLTFSGDNTSDVTAENELKVTKYIMDLIWELNRTGKLPGVSTMN